MIAGSLFFLSLLAAPAFIENVETRVEAGHLVIAASAGTSLAGSTTRVRVYGNRVFVDVSDTRVRSTNRNWEGAVPVIAHRHKGEVELEAVLPAGATCTANAEVTTSADGKMVARFSCTGLSGAPTQAGTARKEPTALPVAKPALPVQATAKPAVAAAAEPAVVPPAAPRTPEPVTPPRGPVPAVSSAPRIEAAHDPLLAARLSDHTPMPVAPPASKSHLWTIILVALGLAVAIGLGVVVRRWRRLSVLASEGAIEIIENRSLGAGRSLLLARVEGEAFLLSVNKTGITLLRHVGGGTAQLAVADLLDAAEREMPPDVGNMDDDPHASAFIRLYGQSGPDDRGDPRSGSSH